MSKFTVSKQSTKQQSSVGTGGGLAVRHAELHELNVFGSKSTCLSATNQLNGVLHSGTAAEQ